MSNLLPPNATNTELVLESAESARFDLLPIIMDTLWNTADIRLDLLPWLAWALDTLVWTSELPEDIQRNAVQASVHLHDKMGTPYAVRIGLESIGYGGVTTPEINVFRTGEYYRNASIKRDVIPASFSGVRVIEPLPSFWRNGDHLRDGTITRRESFAYQFDVQLPESFKSVIIFRNGTYFRDGSLNRDLTTDGFPIGREIDFIIDAINTFKNARSHLRHIYILLIRRDATVLRDGIQRRNGGILND